MDFKSLLNSLDQLSEAVEKTKTGVKHTADPGGYGRKDDEDDEGKNVLRRPDGEERYPDFDLYRALAADVHRAVPSKQIERPLFSSYRCSAVPSGETVYNLFI